MKHPVLLLTAALVVATATASPATAAEADAAKVARGQHLVTIMVCHDCHTPWAMGPNGPAPDMTRMLSGHPQQLAMPPAPALPAGPWMMVAAATNTAWAGPWGTSFTANLTPDKETGIGTWSEADFVATIRNGRHQGRGRQLLPPMPWEPFSHASDEELAAIFAYLQSIPAINNKVPDPVPPAAPPSAP